MVGWNFFLKIQFSEMVRMIHTIDGRACRTARIKRNLFLSTKEWNACAHSVAMAHVMGLWRQTRRLDQSRKNAKQYFAVYSAAWNVNMLELIGKRDNEKTTGLHTTLNNYYTQKSYTKLGQF